MSASVSVYTAQYARKEAQAWKSQRAELNVRRSWNSKPAY